MARLPRLVLPDLAHLVALYCHRGQAAFVDDADRQAFLAALRDSAREHRVAVEAYVLADEHVHLLLRPAEPAGLSAALQGLGRRYVAQFNRRHVRRGSLWAGRFRAAVLQPGPWVLRAMCFIDQHAARQAASGGAPSQAWSSAAHHLGSQRDALLSEGPDWWALGNTPFEREAAFRKLMDAGLPDAVLRDLIYAAHKGWPMGSADWLAQLAEQSARPVAPRARGRPPRSSKR